MISSTLGKYWKCFTECPHLLCTAYARTCFLYCSINPKSELICQVRTITDYYLSLRILITLWRNKKITAFC